MMQSIYSAAVATPTTADAYAGAYHIRVNAIWCGSFGFRFGTRFMYSAISDRVSQADMCRYIRNAKWFCRFFFRLRLRLSLRLQTPMKTGNTVRSMTLLPLPLPRWVRVLSWTNYKYWCSARARAKYYEISFVVVAVRCSLFVSCRLHWWWRKNQSVDVAWNWNWKYDNIAYEMQWLMKNLLHAIKIVYLLRRSYPLHQCIWRANRTFYGGNSAAVITPSNNNM